MESLSCHLMWVAAATYCSILAPKGLLATLIGVLGMAHFSLGRGSGSFFGGFLIGNLGTREAFRYMGLMAVVGGFMYFGLDLIYLRRFDVQSDEKEEEEIEKGESEKLTEPKTRDQGTTMSQERLSLWVKYNQIGSLASLPRGSKVISVLFLWNCVVFFRNNRFCPADKKISFNPNHEDILISFTDDEKNYKC